MSGLFNYPKTFVDDEVLTNEDLNAQFEAAKDNMIAEKLEGASTVNNVYNANKAIAQVNPSPVGPTNFAASVEDEIKRLRFAISQIKGTPDYTEPSIGGLKKSESSLDLNIVFDSKKHFIGSGSYFNSLSYNLFLEPLFYNDSNSPVQGVSYGDIQADVSGRTFFRFKNKVYVGCWFKTTEPNIEIIESLSMGFSVYTNGSGRLVLDYITKKPIDNALKELNRLTSTDPVIDGEWHRVIVSFDTINDKVSLFLDSSLVGFIDSSTLNPYQDNQHTIFIRQIPDLTYIYTTIGSSWSFDSLTPPSPFVVESVTGTASVSEGVLNISCSGSQNVTHKVTSPAPDFSSSFRMDFNLKVIQSNPGTSATPINIPVFVLAQNSAGLRVRVGFLADRIIMLDGDNTDSVLTIYHDCTQETFYSLRYTSSGTLASLHINNIVAAQMTIVDPVTIAESRFEFGVQSGSGQSGQCEFSFVRVTVGTDPSFPNITTAQDILFSDVFASSGELINQNMIEQLGMDSAKNTYMNFGEFIPKESQQYVIRYNKLANPVYSLAALTFVSGKVINHSGLHSKTLHIKGSFTPTGPLVASFALFPDSYLYTTSPLIADAKRLGFSVLSVNATSSVRQEFNLMFPLEEFPYLNAGFQLRLGVSANSLDFHFEDLEFWIV